MDEAQHPGLLYGRTRGLDQNFKLFRRILSFRGVTTLFTVFDIVALLGP